jgi:hypothetical protein
VIIRGKAHEHKSTTAHCRPRPGEARAGQQKSEVQGRSIERCARRVAREEQGGPPATQLTNEKEYADG